MPIKALRLRIVKPYNPPDEPEPLSWEKLSKTLGDLRYAASKMANYVIQQNYMWEFFRQNYRLEHGEYPRAADHKDKFYCYPALAAMFPAAAGQLVNQVEQHAKKVWGARKAEVLNLRQSVPSFKLDFPIIVHRESFSLREIPENDRKTFCFVVKANLTAKATGRTNYSFLVDAGENSKRAIVKRIMSQQYRHGALQIKSDRKGKWYCIIPYEFQPEDVAEFHPGRIMGIDLGVSMAVYWAFSDSYKRGSISGQEISEFRRRVQARRRNIQEQGKYCGDGRIGHGRRRRLLPIEVLQDKEANFRDTTNHRYARRIIEEAVRNKCGVIQLEELTGIKEKSPFLRNWTYFDLQAKIKDKAAEFGIEVRIVDPKYTSQRCSQCGHIDRANRPDQATFVCTHCGYGKLYHCFACGNNQPEAGNCKVCGETTVYMKVNADYNAAKNLAVEGIAEIIAAKLAAGTGQGGPEKKTNPEQKRNPKRTPKPR